MSTARVNSRARIAGILGPVVVAACLVPMIPAPAPAGWTTLPNAPVPLGRHDDVFFVNPDLGWVVNGIGEIHRTTDGGESWELQLVAKGQTGDPYYFRSVGFVDSQKGWVGTIPSEIEPFPITPLLYVTTNGGAVWTPVPAKDILPPQPEGVCGIWVVNSSVAYACGVWNGPARVIKTTDGGMTWISSDLAPQASALIDCYFFDENNGFVVGGTGLDTSSRTAVILATTDGGATWETRHTTNRTGEWCWKISFPTPSIGYVSIESFSPGSSYFLKTTDGGQTWEDLFFLNGYLEQGIGFASPALGWIGGHGAPTYETTDGGVSWHLAGFGESINRFRFLSETLGYAVGETVYKYSASVTAVAGGGTSSSAQFALYQNHPNPFRHTTAIRFTLARSSHVRATVCDAQGRTILTLLEGNRPAGTHELTWNALDRVGNPVSAGVYWYRLETDQDAQAKKLVVR